MSTRSGERGSVTAELAVALPAVVLLVATVAGAGALGRAHVQCRDAAWTVARLLARGDSPDRARSAGQAAAPEAADVDVSTRPGTVTVTVRASVPVLPAEGTSLPLDCRVTAPVEPGVVPPGGDR